MIPGGRWDEQRLKQTTRRRRRRAARDGRRTRPAASDTAGQQAAAAAAAASRLTAAAAGRRRTCGDRGATHRVGPRPVRRACRRAPATRVHRETPWQHSRSFNVSDRIIQICSNSTGLEESVRMTENRNKWRKYVHGVANPRIEHG